MTKSRMEAFSDGVISVIITIMVLEMRAPQGSEFTALRPLIPVFLSYVMSFVYLGIYWNNHHHMLQAVHSVNGRILWANSHLLFWLSLVPFVTNWLGETHFAAWPVAVYGIVLLLAAIAYYVLARTLVAHHGPESALAIALGADFKGRISIVIYAVAIAFAFVAPWISGALYVLVALMWLIPDRRFERVLTEARK
ncbi:MAG TPA: TMEM175 family protein [Candidatus Limnocylindrales bacterium]|nr:TMEM175 family protein [Candidatus Limnocylindrales bacterium]